MSRTFRRTRTGEKVKDKDNCKFCSHDITPILDGIRQSQKAEEKNYFKKFKDKKFNQPPKSRGSTW